MGKVIPSLWAPGVPRASCFFALFPDSPKKWLVLLIYFTGLQPESSVILPHASWPQDPSADHRTDIINRLRAVLFNRASLGSQGTDTEAEGRPRVSPAGPGLLCCWATSQVQDTDFPLLSQHGVVTYLF